jgi:hypothetical protein
VSSTDARALSAEFSALLVSVGFMDSFLVFQSCISHEISIAQAPNIFFRGNSFGIRIATDLLRAYGQIYLDHLSAPIRAHVNGWSEDHARSYEVSTYRVPSQELDDGTVEAWMEEAQPKFLRVCELLLDTLCTTPVPDYIKYMLNETKKQVEAKWPDGGCDVVGGMLILRIAVPTIAILPDLPPTTQRVVLRAAQVLQSLSNEVRMTREPDMRFLDPWMDAKQGMMRDWKRSVLESVPDTIEAAAASLPAFPTPTSQYPKLMTFFEQSPELKQAAQDTP